MHEKMLQYRIELYILNLILDLQQLFGGKTKSMMRTAAIPVAGTSNDRGKASFQRK